jgi:hypothetical protein
MTLSFLRYLLGKLKYVELQFYLIFNMGSDLVARCEGKSEHSIIIIVHR